MRIKPEEVMVEQGKLRQVGVSFVFNKASQRKAVFRCDCGVNCVVSVMNVLSGNTRSCGCHKSRVTADLNRTHGCTVRGRKSKGYSAWSHIKSRCENQGNKDYGRYGGRGIRVCDVWRNSFSAFVADMGEPGAGMTIERIDNNGDYEPGNCRWATRREQSANTVRTRRVTVGGVTTCASHMAEIHGVSKKLVVERMRNGKTIDQALTTPVRRKHRPTEEAD